jgi:hypothetical protein
MIGVSVEVLICQYSGTLVCVIALTHTDEIVVPFSPAQRRTP